MIRVGLENHYLRSNVLKEASLCCRENMRKMFQMEQSARQPKMFRTEKKSIRGQSSYKILDNHEVRKGLLCATTL